MTKEEFWHYYKKKLGDKYLTYFTPDEVYDKYYENVYPALPVIMKYRVGDNKVIQDELAAALFVNTKMFKAMKQLFPELEYALSVERDIMKMKSEIDLQKGLHATEFKNAKFHEMNLSLYNDEYKNKGQDVQVEIPKTLDIVIRDASVDEETLD